MLAFVKQLALQAVNAAIAAEPAFAAEVITTLEKNALPAVENYVSSKLPALLSRAQTILNNRAAVQDVPIKVLPALSATAPAGSVVTPPPTERPAAPGSTAAPLPSAPAPAAVPAQTDEVIE